MTNKNSRLRTPFDEAVAFSFVQGTNGRIGNWKVNNRPESHTQNIIGGEYNMYAGGCDVIEFD
jgi:hypothetical protein